MLNKSKNCEFSSEEDFLKFLDEFFPLKNKGVILGRGDDCALIKPPEKMLISSDIFLEGIHFDKKYFSPYHIGYKALAVNISDIISMGGTPLGFNMNLMLTGEECSRKFFKEFFEGMLSLCKKYNLYLAGGDISWANSFGVDITIWGEVKERYLSRRNSKIGDVIFLSGEIGLSRTGFIALSRGISKEFPEGTKTHLTPYIPVLESKKIIKNPYVNSMMDVSDGVFKDIFRLLKPSHGAKLEISPTDLHPEVVKMAKYLGEDPVIFAGLGGEDYVLMGTCAKEGLDFLRKQIPDIKVIGTVVEENRFSVNEQDITGGFDHFMENKQ